MIIQRRRGFDRFTVVSYCVLAKPVLSGQKEARGDVGRNRYGNSSHRVRLLPFAFSCTFISALFSRSSLCMIDE